MNLTFKHPVCHVLKIKTEIEELNGVFNTFNLEEWEGEQWDKSGETL